MSCKYKSTGKLEDIGMAAVQPKIVSIKSVIDSITYKDSQKQKEESILSKLFK